MTKRFEVYKVIGSFHEWSIEDNVTDNVVSRSIMHKYEADRLCEKLNGLNDELGKYRILYASKEKTAEVLLRDGIALEHEIKSLKTENQKLKQTILYLIGCLECEVNMDLEDECQQLLGCSYKEAKEKYGGCSYNEITEKYVWK